MRKRQALWTRRKKSNYCEVCFYLQYGIVLVGGR